MSNILFFSEREITVACNSACTCGGRGLDNDPCPACEVWHKTIGNGNIHAEQICNHPIRFIVSADEGTHYCLMCAYQAAQAEIAKARQAALEEAAQFVLTHRMMENPPRMEACRLADQSQKLYAAEIRVLIHASQQARAGDAASLRSPRS